MSKGFIGNYDLIQETARVDDLFDFEDLSKSFRSRLDALDRPSIVGLVGKFGSGKSTMLHQLGKSAPKDELWIEFDAWKYPDRKDLWEGFILDFSDQTGYGKQIKKKLKGEDGKSKGIDIAGGIAKGVPIAGPGIESFIKAFKDSPATRVYELQDYLTKMIIGAKRTVFVVVEDIDRSGDAGIYFLETLKQFQQSLADKGKLVVIVPMSDENYNDPKNYESYLKCLDVIENFEPKITSTLKFVEEAFDPSLFEGELKENRGRTIWTGTHKKTQIASFLDILLDNSSISIRKLKVILRRANIVYKGQQADGRKPDWRVTVCFEASKHLIVGPTQESTYHSKYKTSRLIENNSPFGVFLGSLEMDRPFLYREDRQNKARVLLESRFEIKCVPFKDEATTPAWPFFCFTTDGAESLCVCDYYLDY